jgi:hypothetical protein
MRWTARADGLLTARPFVSTALRRLLLLGLLAAGWLLGMTLATAAAGHAETTPARPVADGERRAGLLDAHDHAVTDLVNDSLHGLVRTAEGVPGTLRTTVHHPLRKTVRSVTATLGDTPRVLGRTGPADAPHPHAPHSAPGRGTGGLPPLERGAAAGHPITVPPPAGSGASPGARSGPGSRTSSHANTAADPDAPRHAKAGLPDHPRTPAPYAPAAPVSLTAGPAASSSKAAGPAFLLRGLPRHPLNAPAPAARGAFWPVPHAPAREPRHTPD